MSRYPIDKCAEGGESTWSDEREAGYPVRMDTYYHPPDLAKFPEIGANAPELAKKFFEYYGAVFQDGALTAREKSLIALGVAHAVQCPYCIDAYTQDTLAKGCDLEQLTEAVHVAAAIKGGSALVHGVQMRNVATRVGM
jgi:alkylhydroperoxidase/carboxymuconolactone decarboxylase family protein